MERLTEKDEEVKGTYEIVLDGCHDSTVFQMMLTESEYKTLLKVSEEANKTSTYCCMPTMYVTKAEVEKALAEMEK